MKGLTRWQKGATPLLAIVFLALTVTVPMILPAVEAAAAVDATAAEARMLELVNQARNTAGLPSLYAERQLTDFARAYSAEMIQYGFFGHVSPASGNLQQRIAARGITGWTLAGENIAKAPSVEVAFEALMNSPGHRENILRAEFNCIGVGVVAEGNTLYITQEFMCFSPIPETADRGGNVAPAPAGTSPAAPAPSAPPSNSFDSYLLLMNPNPEDARVKVDFQGEDGGIRSFSYMVAAGSRFTVPVRETVGCGSFSAQVESDLPVLAERAMYFSYEGRRGGHDSIGASSASRTWFFAEGYTGDNFDTWILLQNPNDSEVAVTLNFMRPDGAVITRRVNILPRRRHSVHVDEIPGLESADVSTQVVADLPVVAERAMYFSYAGKDGGHGSIGASSASRTWFFAEGYTGDSFDTWILLQNPNEAATTVTLRFMKPDGSVVQKQVSVPGRRRYTVHVDEIPGLESADVSTSVTSDLPIVAERAMYFDYRGRRGGHVTVGAASPAESWYLAEGYTGGEFDEYVLLLNPGEEKAVVKVVFMRSDGLKVEREVEIGPHARHTIHVDEVEGLADAEVSTEVRSSSPVVVELAQYFNYRGMADGNNAMGASEPSRRWYFAEGCVQ
ncbi:MAG: DUF5719 family protein [Actinomycetota bacterium]|nr:DUF5719 family protein [Actinomycetota bacterium]